MAGPVGSPTIQVCGYLSAQKQGDRIMKWSAVGLVVLGVVAAACAAILVMALRAGSQSAQPSEPQGPTEIDVIVAARALPALSIVDKNHIVVKTFSSDKVPDDSLTGPLNVIGKVLDAPMVEGQVFRPSCFATEGTGQHLAVALPRGMRAVCISLAQHTGLEGLLYPGSVVDVLASFRIPRKMGGRMGAFSTVLIQGVEVLAIEDRTIVSGPASGDDKSPRQRGRNRNITLMVTPRQAEALQLATEHGSLSLAMRSPLDLEGFTRKPTFLSDLSEALIARESPPPVPVAVAATTQPTTEALPGVELVVGPAVVVPGRRFPTLPGVLTPPDAPILVYPAPVKRGRWETVVIRGGKTKKQTFPLPEETNSR